jgi:peptidoglycan-N-acetylglucosamine deacetylase
MTAARPLASLSLDADNLWSYLKTHGDSSWCDYPSYLEQLLPIAMDVLQRAGLPCTFFLVGRDAADARHADALRELVRRGFDVGNHSYEHEPWLHQYAPQQVADEIARAEEAIEGATGRRPIGFRGPGFSWTHALFAALATRGYLYDASTFPTFVGPLARAYYFWTSSLSGAERAQRAALFGRWGDGLRPLTPYRWHLFGERTLLEIPVTTCPVLRTPFHVSYLLYLAGRSEKLALAYFRLALALCRATGVEPSLLLHPLDLLGGDEQGRLAFFPAMQLPGARKRELVARLLGEFAAAFDVHSLDSYARIVAQRTALGACAPDEDAAAADARIAAPWARARGMRS